MTDTINSYTINPNPAKRCDKCGIIVGPDAPVKAGLLVKEGPTTGFFHNRQCYDAASKEMSDAKEKGNI